MAYHHKLTLGPDAQDQDEMVVRVVRSPDIKVVPRLGPGTDLGVGPQVWRFEAAYPWLPLEVIRMGCRYLAALAANMEQQALLVILLQAVPVFSPVQHRFVLE
jgi:hypothetical protein